VEVLATLFAEVFLGAGVFVHDSNTTAVLPNFADVALQKEASQILRDICRIDEGIFNPFFYSLLAVFVKQLWRARVFVEAADATNGLIVFPYLICAIRHLVLNCLCLR